jgi:exopolysaccharide biosynthesis polyprenyl glycosylphosphotransferase
MERRIEDETHADVGDRAAQHLESAQREADDDLRVIEHEGDVAVIRDLQPERVRDVDEVEVEVDRAAAIEAPTTEAPPRALPPRAPDGATQTRYRMLVAGHVASDVFCLNVVLFATGLLDDVIAARSLGAVGWLLAIGGSLAWVGIFHAFGLYATRHFNSSEEIRRVVGATSSGVAVLMIFGAGGLTGQGTLGFAFATLVGLEIVTRLSWRRYSRGLRAKGLLAYRTMIVGSAHDAAYVANSLAEDERTGFYPVGRIAADHGTDEEGAPPFLGSLSDAARLVEEWSVEALIVASPTLTTSELGRLQQLARREHLALRLVARVPHMLTSRLTLQRVGPLMTVAVRQAKLTGTQAALKRAFDITIGGIGLLISLPIQLVVGVLVAVTSPGPVLFRQQRVTRGNRLFTVYKFRTMDRDADRILDARSVDRTQPFFKDHDVPVTRVGRVLRTLSLDELPQLWNVVRGDMSLVGPRPLTAEQVWANPEMLGPRHDVRTGLTGWWQVNGRSDVSAEEAIKQDLFYIENWSLLLDLYVLLRTVGVVLGRKGAR